MNAAISTKLETTEEVTECFDALCRNPGVEMKVRMTGIGGTMTMVMLFAGGQQIAVGRGRGVVNALANALGEMQADEAIE